MLRACSDSTRRQALTTVPFNDVVPYPRAMRRFPSIRQSWLSQFDDCGLATRFEFEYRSGSSTHPQARGTIFHRFAGRALREMARHKEKSIEVDVALAILHEVLRQQDIDRQCPECFGENILPGISRRGLRTCGSCKRKFETELVNLPMSEVKDLYWVVKKWARDSEFDVRALYSVEERLRARVPYGDFGRIERELTGQTDVLLRPEPTHVVVLDWKDTWGIPGPTELGHKGYFQQRFYAWLIMNQPEFRRVEQVTLREFYVRYSEPREATITRLDLDDITAELGALAERFDRCYEENTWVPTAGKHCNFCMRPSACPIPVFARDEGRIIDMARATQVAQSLLVAEKVVKDNRKALRAFSDVKGAIPVKSKKEPKVMAFKQTTATVRPERDELLRALQEAGPNGMIDVDALYKTRTATRFGVYSPGEVAVVDEAQQDEELQEQLLASIEQAQKGKGKR